MLSTSREFLWIEDLLGSSMSDDEDAALVQAIKARPEQDEEDANDSELEPVVPMTLKKAREMFVKSIKNLQENQTNASLQSIFLLLKDWFEPWRRLDFLPDHAKLTLVPF